MLEEEINSSGSIDLTNDLKLISELHEKNLSKHMKYKSMKKELNNAIEMNTRLKSMLKYYKCNEESIKKYSHDNEMGSDCSYVSIYNECFLSKPIRRAHQIYSDSLECAKSCETKCRLIQKENISYLQRLKKEIL